MIDTVSVMLAHHRHNKRYLMRQAERAFAAGDIQLAQEFERQAREEVVR